MAKTLSQPKIFISYSWTTPEHEEWVLNLAKRLVNEGVNVTLDKWHLKPGHDAHAFMESMVTDSEIEKVLMICDEAYANKADARKGGVGTEAQVMSSEIYTKVKQEKFIPIIREFKDGKPCLPMFVRTRLFINMSTFESENENFEPLVRCIFNKPMHVMPEIGPPPAWLDDEKKSPASKTASKFLALKESIKKGNQSQSQGLLTEYLEEFSQSLEGYRITSPREEPFDQAVMDSFEAFKPQRDEFVDFLSLMLKYSNTPRFYDAFNEFLQGAVQYKYMPAGQTSWNELWVENFSVILHELLLYSMALILKYKAYDFLNAVCQHEFFVGSESHRYTAKYDVFYCYPKALNELRNQRLKLQKKSVFAMTIKDRATNSEVPFSEIMQADLILYIRGLIHGNFWFPGTTLYASYHQAFPILERSKLSDRFFETEFVRIVDVPNRKILNDAILSREVQSEESLHFKGLLRSNLIRD